MDQEIMIRPAESIPDYRACQDAQRRAWGISEDGYLVPVATMVGAQLHGGLVLGAFLANGEAVGLSFAFLGRVEGRLCLYSQLTGVVPGYQGKGVGYRLKQVQWEIARTRGLDFLAWAFDPLQSGNAHFNLGMLGATAGRYVENMYGARSDALNSGVTTDRLIADWSTAGPLGRPPVQSVATLPRLLEVRFRPDGVPVVGAVTKDMNAERVLLEVPDQIAVVRTASPDLAEQWCLAVRSAFADCFAHGFRAVGFVRFEEENHRRCGYILARR